MILLEKELPRILVCIVCIVGSRFQIFFVSQCLQEGWGSILFLIVISTVFFFLMCWKLTLWSMHRIRWTVYPYILYIFLYQNNHKQTLRFTYSFPLFFLFSSCSSLEQRSRLWGLLLCQDNNSLWGHRLSHPIIAKPSTDLDLGARPLCWNRPAPERAPLRTQEQKSQCVRSTCGIYRSKCLWCQISVFFFFFKFVSTVICHPVDLRVQL